MLKRLPRALVAMTILAALALAACSGDDDGASPAATATPDITKDGWFQPFVAADAGQPKKSGMVAGIPVGNELETFSANNPGPPCIEPSLADASNAEANGNSPVGIAAARVPAGFSITKGPEYTVCANHLTLIGEATVRVSNPPANARGDLGKGVIRVYRRAGLSPLALLQSENRWSETRIAGLPAAALRPIVESVGTSALIVYDEKAGITTTLLGEGVYPESLAALMGSLLK